MIELDGTWETVVMLLVAGTVEQQVGAAVKEEIQPQIDGAKRAVEAAAKPGENPKPEDF